MADAPTLAFVPPTPLRFQTPSASMSRVQQRLPPTRKDTSDSQASDAIYSIYSMYGDERSYRASSRWSNSDPSHYDRGRVMSTDRPVSNAYGGIDYTPEPADEIPPAPPPIRVDYSSSPHGSLATTSSARPSSSYATPSSLRTQSDLFENSRLSAGSNMRKSDHSASSYSPQSKEFRRSGSPHSKRSSRRGSPSPQQRRSLRELPPLPPSTHVTPFPTPPRQPSPSIPPTPPRQPSPNFSRQPSTTPPRQPSSLLPSTPPRHHSPSPSLLTPKTSVKHHGKHPPPLSSPSSKVSLTPSDGEDLDGFHVRNTYAQLEASGVKGDGYEEGVERTRARVGTSRTSQLQADAALGDGTEKTRNLDEKEIKVLKSVDRYGFFSITSHDRLILLNATPLLKKFSRVPVGPTSAPANATPVRALPPVSIPPKEADRIGKWNRMLVPQKRGEGANVDTWRIKPSKESKLRERTYKGIPDRWRRAAWDLWMSRFSGFSPRTFDALARDYRDGLEKPSTYDIQIDLDVPRTISGHIMFRTRYGAGQRSLFHVLHSFSLRCSSCGYVQGMGPIAATLLCYFEPERVYASLVALHDAYKLHDVFNAGFPGMLEAIYVQEMIMQTTMPAVYEAFRKHMISTTSYATKWYITLFANSVPFQTQLRLWDVFLLEGYDLFVAVAVSIVWVYRDHITSAAANFETILSLLSSFFIPESEDALMSWIEIMLGDRKLRANMTKWRQDWKQLVASGKEGSALL